MTDARWAAVTDAKGAAHVVTVAMLAHPDYGPYYAAGRLLTASADGDEFDDALAIARAWNDARAERVRVDFRAEIAKGKAKPVKGG